VASVGIDSGSSASVAHVGGDSSIKASDASVGIDSGTSVSEASVGIDSGSSASVASVGGDSGSSASMASVGGDSGIAASVASDASVGIDSGSSASVGGDSCSSASAASVGGDSGSPASVGGEDGSYASTGGCKGAGFDITFPPGPILHLVPVAARVVVHGLGELNPQPVFIITPNNEVLFQAQLLLAAVIGCGAREAAVKLRDIAQKEQRLSHDGKDLRALSNEVSFIFHFF
jgi:hypothetical protein